MFSCQKLWQKNCYPKVLKAREMLLLLFIKETLMKEKEGKEEIEDKEGNEDKEMKEVDKEAEEEAVEIEAIEKMADRGEIVDREDRRGNMWIRRRARNPRTKRFYSRECYN